MFGLEGLLDSELGVGAAITLFVALVAALAFEFVNGFHDTANAVATVIYTRTLPATAAVVYSGVCNFVGLVASATIGGVGVAVGITRLLPVELVVASGTGRGLAMVGALLLAAIVWNLGTWARGLPASSSHTLIGAILGVGLASSALDGHPGEGVSWGKAAEVMVSLLVSPVFGLLAAGGMLLLFRAWVRRPEVFAPPGDRPPPRWVRALLIATCGAVSLAHGSNDGQKGIGLMMLIVVGIVPGGYALDREASAERVHDAAEAAAALDARLATMAEGCGESEDRAVCSAARHAHTVAETLRGHRRVADLSRDERWRVRESTVRLEAALRSLDLDDASRIELEAERRRIARLTDYAPTWVLILTALALGIGTMIGWKRIVVTVGEKIGRTHLTYAQGAAAELVAASTIGVASLVGLPVSTTHVLSSGIAGTMLVERAGVQTGTIRAIALAWLLTLPASMFLSALFFVVFSALV